MADNMIIDTPYGASTQLGELSLELLEGKPFPDKNSPIIKLMPYIDDLDCVEGDSKNSVLSFKVGDEPITFGVFGFEGEDVYPEVCDGQFLDILEGYYTRDFRCEDGFADKIYECGNDLLVATSRDNVLTTPYANVSYKFFNKTNKVLYIDLSMKLFENKWYQGALKKDCCCTTGGCDDGSSIPTEVVTPVDPVDPVDV